MGVAVQVDHQIGPQIMNPVRDLGIVQGAGIDETVEGGGQALAQGAGIIGTGGDGDGLEARPVMGFEQFRCQQDNRMLAQVG